MRDDILLEAIGNFWKSHVFRKSRICVAVSGGADSVALFHLLVRLQKRLSIAKLGIAHVNHCLRGAESDGDARFVESLAKKARVAFHLRRLVKTKIPRTGIEEWARNQRYAFFASVMKTQGYDFVATAHTVQDQAETVLLRVLRGTGIRGLAGIAPVRGDGIIRPLLTVNKTTLVGWLADHKLEFREDSSNADTAFTRNWIRHKILPLLIAKDPSAVQHCAAVADNAAAIERILEAMANKWINIYVVKSTRNSFIIDKKGFCEGDIASEAMVSMLRERAVEFDRQHIESIAENKDRTGKTFLLQSGWRYRCEKKTMLFYKGENKERESSFSYVLTIGATTTCKKENRNFRVEKYKREKRGVLSFSDPMIAFLDAEKIKGPLVFRSFDEHEKFWPYGAKGPSKVNDFLKKQKHSKFERMLTGVVSEKKGEILWIAGLRIGHQFRITPQTREILKISCKPG